MIEKIIEWCVQNRFMVILCTVFVIVAGTLAMGKTPIDAIPDLSDVQVIVYTEYPGQGPRVVEDQVDLPPYHGHAECPFRQGGAGDTPFFGYSFVYIIFEDGTDLYWARSRVLEYLNFVAGKLPPGVTPSLGPDATGVGWVYEYVLKDTTQTHDLQQLRSIQDWFLRYETGIRSRCFRGGQHRRFCEAVPSGGGSQPAIGLRPLHRKGENRHFAIQHGCGRQARGDGRDGIHGAGVWGILHLLRTWNRSRWG